VHHQASGLDAVAVQELAERTADMLAAIQAIGERATALVNTIQRTACLSMEDQWARTWGETVSKADAARMLGVGQTKVRDYIAQGILSTTPDGRVRVRLACRWAYGDTAASVLGDVRASPALAASKPAKNKRFIP
jgi:hypothetical protein